MKFLKSTLLLVATASFSLAAILPTKKAPKQSIEIPLASEDTQNQIAITSIEYVDYIVKVGDTLSTIFAQWQIPYTSLQKVLETDSDYLHLDTIKPGDHLEIEMDSTNNTLNKLVYNQSIVDRAIYHLTDDGSYRYEFNERPSEWIHTLYSGFIQGSFSLSAHKQGLSTNQIANITRIVGDNINFTKELRANDKFNILVAEQYVNDHKTGNTEIKGIEIKAHRKQVSAFLANDGRFYDRSGESLEQAFDRFPVDKIFRRVTSHFNPKRQHPVTGRVSPHNGTDYATPVGSPVYSIGDGKVVVVRNHPYAGKYLVIEHNNIYKTRYLHLSKFFVQKGQEIKRGEKIALSGATGRITGPHLHFELLVRNRPVDPYTYELPVASSITNDDLANFEQLVAEFDFLVTDQDNAKSLSASMPISS
ncbi:peptidoglycan DD-metalloendopeptidase family protein [Photobacterium minamisatsumaniensis]|uniref:peptidoglycan DD-metalloendopeptidase family protein n=1 Tax=Photobacterium minamisatsumaniensis TaxID=2910233 RepID=UPI003D0D7658